jgi:CO/xanthine dehydrogenase Mo-binding subunit
VAKVAVICYSAFRHTYRIAEDFEAGAKSAGGQRRRSTRERVRERERIALARELQLLHDTAIVLLVWVFRLSKSEMGQGVATALPTILADELDASMDQVRTEFAPADPRYVYPGMRDMVTGGSTSTRDSWLPFRHAGATARAMLIADTSSGTVVEAVYRAPFLGVNVVRGVLSGGNLIALTHQVVQKSWLRRWLPPAMKTGIDIFAMTEADDAPYAIPNFRVTYIDHEHGIPVGSWRAPNANWNGFVTETFVDELAHTAGNDPLAFRLALLKHNPRAANVLTLAAQKAGWGRKQTGAAQGLAVIFWNGSYGAIVADVSLQGKMPKVHRVVAAVDCGTVVNPDIVVQQAQGATTFGLSAALSGKITIQNGRVQQNNFYDYTVLHMADAPSIEVHVVSSTATPTGIGEVCTPPIAPAVGNAIFVLPGKRVRTLPFSDALA